jgi:hypothetical protein
VSAWATVVVSALALRLAAHPAETGMPESAPALRWLGLGFTPDQARQLEPAARESRNAFDAIRSKPTSPDVPQSLVFRPFAHVPPMPDGLRWSPPRGVRRPVRDEDLAWMGVADLAALLRSRQVTSGELVRLSLQRLHERDRTIRAVVSWCDERAIEAARRADAELRAGRWKGPLHGVPFGAKDLLDVAALPTSWGVAVRSNAVATSSATVIQRLEDAGAIMVAKLSLGELAMGDVWHGGKTRNPWAPDTGSSGSSAGSAAAVAGSSTASTLSPSVCASASDTPGSAASALVCAVNNAAPRRISRWISAPLAVSAATVSTPRSSRG